MLERIWIGSEDLSEPIGRYKDKEIEIKNRLKTSEAVTAALHHELGHFFEDTLPGKYRSQLENAKEEFNKIKNLIQARYFYIGPFGEWTGTRKNYILSHFSEFFAEMYKDLSMKQEVQLLNFIKGIDSPEISANYLFIVNTLKQFMQGN